MKVQSCQSHYFSSDKSQFAIFLSFTVYNLGDILCKILLLKLNLIQILQTMLQFFYISLKLYYYVSSILLQCCTRIARLVYFFI